MRIKYYRFLMLLTVLVLSACTGIDDKNYTPIATPTVDYIESLDVYSAPHKDSFLNQLAMNYRSYAIYNARTSGYSEIGELFAQKAVAAFSGETPFPETLDNWPVQDQDLAFSLNNASNDLMNQLKNDATDNFPELAAEAQAKFDCWLSASASGQMATASECQVRFQKALISLQEECKIAPKRTVVAQNMQPKPAAPAVNAYYPETRSLIRGTSHAREGTIIVNNVNIPQNLINPVPVQPMVFNQNIFGGANCADGNSDCAQQVQEEPIPAVGEELVTRKEFIDMMMAMRAELATINSKLDRVQNEKTMIKVQQIPLEPKQHVMEEVFEVQFDFNKAVIKPEYQDVIRKLATACQNNKNMKVSVVGHTDTVGSSDYNYALGGRRAESVQKMLIKYGIPAGQIVAVSSGKTDNKVPTGDQVKNRENRRVRVVKEVSYTEPAQTGIAVEEYSTQTCGMYGCQ